MRTHQFTLWLSVCLLAACNSIATPTITLTQSEATLTPTPTSTATETLTATPTTTATFAPTATPIPIFTWSTEFENGLIEFNGSGVEHWADGPNSYYEIVEDPTDSGKGKIYRGSVKGLPPESNHFGGNRHAPFPDVYFPFVEGPYVVEAEIWISKPFPSLRVSPPVDTDPWFSPLNVFDTSEEGAKEGEYDIPPWHFAVTTHLGVDPRLNDGINRLVLMTNEDDWLGSISPIAFPLEQWVKIRLEVGDDRVARLYQDNELVSEKRLPPNTRLGIVGGHWGLYAGRAVEDFVVLNDNLVIVIYPPKK